MKQLRPFRTCPDRLCVKKNRQTFWRKNKHVQHSTGMFSIPCCTTSTPGSDAKLIPHFATKTSVPADRAKSSSSTRGMVSGGGSAARRRRQRASSGAPGNPLHHRTMGRREQQPRLSSSAGQKPLLTMNRRERRMNTPNLAVACVMCNVGSLALVWICIRKRAQTRVHPDKLRICMRRCRMANCWIRPRQHRTEQEL